MGDPVKIIDLAKRMIEISGHEPGRDIRIEVVGIRPGEKLHEELFNVDEKVHSTRYGKVMRATRAPLDPGRLSDGLDSLRARVANRDGDSVDALLWDALGMGREFRTDRESTNDVTVDRKG